MRELRAEHVEGDAAFDRLALCDEVEAWALVYELPDEPRGGQAIYVQVATRYPAPTLVLRHVQDIAARRARPSDGARLSLRCPDNIPAPLVGRRRRRAALSAEEVCGDYALQFGVQLVERGLVAAEPSGREVAAALLLADGPGQFIKFGRQSFVLRVARFAEGVDNLFVRRAFDRAGAEDGRLSARRLYLPLEPLEVLVRLLVEGQHVDGVFDRDGAQLL